MQSPFRVIIFSGADAPHILRLVQRIHREVPEAQVCGVLCERRPGKSTAKRATDFLKNLRRPEFVQYAAGKIRDGLCLRANAAGTALLRLIHGGGPAPAPHSNPMDAFASVGCAFHFTSDYHNEHSLEFVRGLKADLGIVYGTRILKPSLFSIPRLGSINIHKRKVPDYRGGGPVGLWELLDNQAEIGVTVHQVTDKLDAGAIVNSAAIPIETFDNLTSLALKAHVVGNDLLVRSVADFARGTVQFTQQRGTGRMFKAPGPERLNQFKKQLAATRSSYRPAGSRPIVKMLAKSLIALPRVVFRNWKRRVDGTFPVNILFHHLVTDRPHRMGISTEYFREHVRFLQKYYDVVSLSEAIRMLQSGSVKRPTVVLTFDDGYRDNFVNLRAVVEETGVPVTMFISSDHVTRGTVFRHDIDYEQHGFVPLTWAQVRQMHATGIEIGSHTRTHFDCGSRDLSALKDEIAGSKDELERHLGISVQSFSFPFGLPENISSEAAELASRTYPYILSAFGGENGAPADGAVKHLRRWCHPNRLWDLELQLQGVLESPMTFEEKPSRDEPATVRPEMSVSFAGRTVPRQ